MVTFKPELTDDSEGQELSMEQKLKDPGATNSMVGAQLELAQADHRDSVYKRRLRSNHPTRTSGFLDANMSWREGESFADRI